MYLETKTVGKTLFWKISRPDRGNALGTTLAMKLWEEATALKKLLANWQISQKHSAIPVARLVLSADTRGRSSKRKIWVAGGDLKELALLTDRHEASRYAGQLSEVCEILAGLPILVIAYLDGEVIGGGAELALAADVRIATKQCKWHFKQLQVGLATGYGGAQRLTRLVGLSTAQKLLFLGEEISATQAAQLGLVHKVAANSKSLDGWLKKYLMSLDHLEPASIARQKEMLKQAYDLNTQTALTRELELFSSLWMNPTHAKFLEKYKVRQN